MKPLRPPSAGRAAGRSRPALTRWESAMGYEVTCSCGQVLPVSEGMAGSSISCGCGRALDVPPLSRLRAQEVTEVVPIPAQGYRPAPEAPPRPASPVEVIAPTEAVLRTGRGDRPGRRVPVAVALTSEAVWIQDTWR